MRRLAILITCGLLAGCDRPVDAVVSRPPGVSPEQVRAADHSILFVGNSHTSAHDIPGLVARMIRHRHPERTVVTHTVGVAFLEDAAANPTSRAEVEQQPWKQVVLQAQKVSSSGKVEYSTTEGMELAAAGKARGADVVFYAEWGLQGKEGDGLRMEKVYRGMADATGVRVACVGRAWDVALARQPELPLYAADGNHQSAVGAFLTAAVLFGSLTGEPPTALADFPYPDLDQPARTLLCEAAAEALSAK